MMNYCSILRNLLSREEEHIEAATFSRDGKFLATGSSEGDINVNISLFQLFFYPPYSCTSPDLGNKNKKRLEHFPRPHTRDPLPRLLTRRHAPRLHRRR